MEKLKRILTLLLLVSIAGFLLGFASSSYFEKHYTAIIIKIKHFNESRFIDEKDVSQLITHYYGDKFIRHPIRDIDLGKLEYTVSKSPYVKSVQVYSNVSGKIVIDIIEREPIARVINNGYVDYYIDKSGLRMPVSDKFAARLLVLNGNIRDRYAYKDTIKDQVLLDAYELSSFIYADPYWKAQIEQIYINDDFEFELIPRIADHVIVFGDTENMLEKFDHLMLFYNECIHQFGWNDYKEVNVKFKNQIVCTKN